MKREQNITRAIFAQMPDYRRVIKVDFEFPLWTVERWFPCGRRADSSQVTILSYQIVGNRKQGRSILYDFSSGVKAVLQKGFIP